MGVAGKEKGWASSGEKKGEECVLNNKLSR